MTKKQAGLCNGVIHAASVAAGGVGAGLAQVPCSDNMIITPIQLTMAISLGKVFGIDLDQSAAKAAVASAAAATELEMLCMPITRREILPRGCFFLYNV